MVFVLKKGRGMVELGVVATNIDDSAEGGIWIGEYQALNEVITRSCLTIRERGYQTSHEVMPKRHSITVINLTRLGLEFWLKEKTFHQRKHEKRYK